MLKERKLCFLEFKWSQILKVSSSKFEVRGVPLGSSLGNPFLLQPGPLQCMPFRRPGLRAWTLGEYGPELAGPTGQGCGPWSWRWASGSLWAETEYGGCQEDQPGLSLDPRVSASSHTAYFAPSVGLRHFSLHV